MNKVVLLGRLTRDPDIRYTQGENSMAVAHFTLAVDRRRGRNNQQDGQQTADFISCVAFGKPAEIAEKYFRKGIKICISGRIQTGSYTNKDGVRVYTTDVIVEDFEFAESRNSQGSPSDYSSFNNYGSSYNNGGAGYNRNTAPAPQQNPSSSGASNGSPAGNPGNGSNAPAPQSAPAQEQPSGAVDGFMNIPDGIDEELPFN